MTYTSSVALVRAVSVHLRVDWDEEREIEGLSEVLIVGKCGGGAEWGMTLGDSNRAIGACCGTLPLPFPMTLM